MRKPKHIDYGFLIANCNQLLFKPVPKTKVDVPKLDFKKLETKK